MFTKIYRTFLLLFFLNINPVYSKISNNNDFKKKNLSSYFSALVSLENQQNKESLKYCMSCVNPYLRINIMDNGQCLCKTCEELSDTPEYYKKV